MIKIIINLNNCRDISVSEWMVRYQVGVAFKHTYDS